MGVLKGDFIGFTIGDYHSSDLGIIRTSDGSRFNENLLPTFSDKTAKVPGRDETLYFRTEYDKKEFPISFAFDSLTEKQIRLLRQILGKKEMQNLIFDESPYKVYKVKAGAPPSLKYICFEENNERIYKGEGSINFVAYYPFAKSRFKYKEDYNYLTIPEWKYTVDNKDEWLAASGIKGKYDFYSESSTTPYGVYECKEFRYNTTGNDGTKRTIKSQDGSALSQEQIESALGNRTLYSIGGVFKTRLYNPGDLETPFKLIINSSVGSWRGDNHEDEILSYDISIEIYHKGQNMQLVLEDIELYGNDVDDLGFIVNSYNHLIEGIAGENEKNGKIYNEKIVKGDFFNIPNTSSALDELPILTIDVTIKSALGSLTKSDLDLLPNISTGDARFAFSNEGVTYDYDYLYY